MKTVTAYIERLEGGKAAKLGMLRFQYANLTTERLMTRSFETPVVFGDGDSLILALKNGNLTISIKTSQRKRRLG